MGSVAVACDLGGYKVVLPGGLERDTLLAPVAPDEPCGEDLEYDAAFLSLMQDAVGTPAKMRYEFDPETRREVPRVIEKARDPDWKDMFHRSSDLMQRSKDIRLAILIARGGLTTEGWTGFAGGVDLVQGLLEEHWDGVYPRIEEDGDATLRTNAVTELADEAMLGRLYRTPLVDMPRIGRFSLRDMAVASGEARPEGEAGTPATPEAIEAAFANAPVEALRTVADAARAVGASVDGIKRVFNERTDFQYSPNLDGLVRHLRDAVAAIERSLETRGEGVADAPPEDGGEAEGADDGAGYVPAAAARRGSGPVGQAIASRADVIKTLDAICAWYAQAEPGSPVPVLLRRARSLVDKSFLDLIRDLAPSGLDQVLVLAGPEAESSG